MSITQARIREIARERFGYERLHPGQAEAVQALLAGRDTLVVMPTGSGKSAIYQIAGLQLDGPTVVVSPLIALQRDQVETINAQGIGDAGLMNSTLCERERIQTLDDVETGKLDFLLLAPEQLAREETLAQLHAARPALFVVDEAHCISAWGHDFRPAYLRLGPVIEELGHPTMLALTATAAPPVRQEIVERLSMRDPRVIVQEFDRPNIWLGVETFSDEEVKRRALLERVSLADPPGIVYAATRKHAEEIAAELQGQGVRAAFYHAGLTARERTAVQDDFMDDRLAVIVATIAFGLGVDKPNVRFVLHHDASDSPDSYYQEIGRAGRDGEAARAILFYRPADLSLHRFFAGAGQIDRDQVERVARAVQGRDAPVPPRELRADVGLSLAKINTALSRLEEVGAVTFLPDGEVVPGERGDEIGAAVEEAIAAQERRKQVERSRIEMMRGYAEVEDCRRAYLLNYFGQASGGPCGYCDNCEKGLAVAVDDADVHFPLNSRVVHQAWGEGLVQRYDGDTMVVLFDSVGYKTLDVTHVVEDGLLRPAP